MKELTFNKIADAIKGLQPAIFLGYNDIREPMFPEGRTDICVIQKDAEDGYSYGRTILYVIYNAGDGIKVEKLYDTGNIHDNFHVWSVKIVNGNLAVRIGYGGVEKTLTYSLP